MHFKIENEYETDLKLLGQIKMSKLWYDLHPQPRSTQLPGKTFSPMPNRFKKKRQNCGMNNIHNPVIPNFQKCVLSIFQKFKKLLRCSTLQKRVPCVSIHIPGVRNYVNPKYIFPCQIMDSILIKKWITIECDDLKLALNF